VSKIVNGNIDKLSIEFLVKLMVRAGLPVDVTSGARNLIRKLLILLWIRGGSGFLDTAGAAL